MGKFFIIFLSIFSFTVESNFTAVLIKSKIMSKEWRKLFRVVCCYVTNKIDRQYRKILTNLIQCEKRHAKCFEGITGWQGEISWNILLFLDFLDLLLKVQASCLWTIHAWHHLILILLKAANQFNFKKAVIPCFFKKK